MAKLTIDNHPVRLLKVREEEYVSLNDIAVAGGYSEPSDRIKSWLRANSTVKFLYEWEMLYNPNFNSGGYTRIKEDIFEDKYRITPTRWVDLTNAIGILPGKRGRYSKGAFAHIDIALHFTATLSEKFQLYLIKEFRRLKEEESMRLGDPFDIKRNLTSGNYLLMVREIIKKTDERLLTHPQPYKSRLPFAWEADLINQLVFGTTAKQWRLNNPDVPANRNQRDYATVVELAVLHNLEFANAMFLRWDMDREERATILKKVAKWLFEEFKTYKTMERLQKLADQFKK